MKSNKLTRTEDFISSGCTTKSYFVQNQAILFALINLASQIIIKGECTWKHSPNRLGLCHDAIRIVRREVIAKRLRTKFLAKLRFALVTPSGKSNDLRSTCLQANGMRKKTRLKAFRKSLFYTLWANKFSYKYFSSYKSDCKALLCVTEGDCTCKKMMAYKSTQAELDVVPKVPRICIPSIKPIFALLCPCEARASSTITFGDARQSFTSRFVRKFASQHTCTTKGKVVQVNEHVTFSNLVSQELFLIQSIQNPRKSHYTIVRPLINCSRHIITMACIINRLPVYPDITNKKVRYSRNRIRKQVIPSLQFFFNPEIEKALFKFSEFHKTA